jgi:hypothetical protein
VKAKTLIRLSEIRGSHVGGDVDVGLLGCGTVSDEHIASIFRAEDEHRVTGVVKR